jgi:hypothetical protein
MSHEPIIVTPRNADTGQEPWQIAVDEETGRWDRFELSDGRVVFINATDSPPWVNHQPPLELVWHPVAGTPSEDT